MTVWEVVSREEFEEPFSHALYTDLDEARNHAEALAYEEAWNRDMDRSEVVKFTDGTWWVGNDVWVKVQRRWVVT